MNPSFTVSEGMEAFATGGLRAWERVMRRGVDAARCGHLLLAEGLYLQALGLAQPLLGAGCAERPDDRIAAFVVTHLNLSDLHRDAERIEDAVAHLGEHGVHPAILAALRAGCMPFPPPGVTLH